MSELTKKDILLMIKIIKANYSYAYQNSTTDDVTLMTNVWYDCLKQYPQQVVNEAFRRAIQASKYPPTLADIVEQINAMQSATEETEQELWDKLDNAIYQASVYYGRFGYTAIPLGETRTQGEIARQDLQDLFNSLPQILKDYLVSPSQLIALTECEDLSYEKGRFLKAMPNLRSRQKIKRETPQEIFGMLDNCLKTIPDTKRLGDSNT